MRSIRACLGRRFRLIISPGQRPDFSIWAHLYRYRTVAGKRPDLRARASRRCVIDRMFAVLRTSTILAMFLVGAPSFAWAQPDDTARLVTQLTQNLFWYVVFGFLIVFWLRRRKRRRKQSA